MAEPWQVQQMSMYEQYKSSPKGAASMAGAELEVSAASIIGRALWFTEIEHSEIAEILGISIARLHEIAAADDISIRDVGRIVKAAGYSVSFETDVPMRAARKRQP